jgi:hypothetical protein
LAPTEVNLNVEHFLVELFIIPPSAETFALTSTSIGDIIPFARSHRVKHMIPLDEDIGVLPRERLMTAHEWLMTLDTYTNETYGRPVSSSVVDSICVVCGGTSRTFNTPMTARAYSQVGLCEHCQALQKSISDKIVPFNQNYRTDSE